ncbi:MAG: sugar phosphate isomerase/epimerase family protein [Eubacteriales bacterium]
MKISTQTCVLANIFGDKKTIQMLAEIGYDCIDYSMFGSKTESPLFGDDFEKYASELKHIADESGICFNQTHAPFPSYKTGNDEYNKKTLPQIIRSIIITSILGAKHVIVHPTALRENQKDFNINFFNNLIPVCKEYNVVVAIENMFGSNQNNGQIIANVCSTGEDFCEYLDALDSRYFTACLDTGHAGLVGETAASMVRTLGHDRLKALHVHDNNHLKDIHTLPFTQSLNWQDITAALKEINYTGDFTFEADNFLRGFPEELVISASKFMLETGRYLVGLCS